MAQHHPPLISLQQYLQVGLPRITVLDQGQSTENTRSGYYWADQIKSTRRWDDFNIDSIQQTFRPLLEQTQIPPEPIVNSVPLPVNSEASARARIEYYLSPLVRRSLRAGFANIEALAFPHRYRTVTFDAGTSAQHITGGEPDLAFFELDPYLRAENRPNRAPGDIKPSFKWALSMGSSPRRGVRTEFNQALSQVNYYMKQHHSRYGFLLTERELVAIQRLDGNGRLELSDAIPWTATGTPEEPVLTVTLGLWYLGMLSSQRQWVMN
ncbi:hypothetical protein PENSTE_c006G05460 [Penicillium steckii]|uniref:Uncharacterized protein n=1 Tax=Penicillium steckii TaxID=303698 RepID=A0A1V6THC5_9EURO|nr:hypothetical protein PENSTE_c006G05460 [Penicillium steckii]